MFEPFSQSFKWLTCTFFLAEKRLSVSLMKLEGQGVWQGNAFLILAFSVISIDWKPKTPRLSKNFLRKNGFFANINFDKVADPLLNFSLDSRLSQRLTHRL